VKKQAIFSWFQRKQFLSFFSEKIKEENPEAIKEPYLFMYMKKITKHIQINKKSQQPKIKKKLVWWE